MSILETLQEICDEAKKIAHSGKNISPTRKTILLLVETIENIMGLDSKRIHESVEQKAANYAHLLREGNQVNKHLLAEVLEELLLKSQMKKAEENE